MTEDTMSVYSPTPPLPHSPTPRVIRVWIPPTFDGIDPEQQVSIRHRMRFANELLETSGKDL